MVHDVLHERYPRHGRDYYQARNAAARKEWAAFLAEHPADALPDERTLSLLDDLGVGLDHLGDHAEAVSVLRDKLRRQQAGGLKGRALYTSYANLGTFLIHGNFRAVQRGEAKARSQLREGLEFIRHSIEVNPQAHFGREEWQATAVEYLLAVCQNKHLLLRFDLIGDCLNKDIDPSMNRCMLEDGLMVRRLDEVAEFLRDPEHSGSSASLRSFITPVGAEEDWAMAVAGRNDKPVQFDEPVLGIVGMWRYGGGPNPLFALTLGEIMMRVGQRYIAWCAYERAVTMKDRFWPDPVFCDCLAAHCRRRQALIEGQLAPEEQARLRPRFQAELAHGLEYQKEYQEYEGRRLAEGASLDDPHFYDAFDSRHDPIASPVGEADRIRTERPIPPGPADLLPPVVLGAGLCAFIMATLLRCFGSASRRLPASV
jgi:hypothetical protein